MFWTADSLWSNTASLFSCSLPVSFSFPFCLCHFFLTLGWRRHWLIVYGLRNSWGKTLLLTTNSWVFAIKCTSGRSEHKHISLCMCRKMLNKTIYKRMIVWIYCIFFLLTFYWEVGNCLQFLSSLVSTLPLNINVGGVHLLRNPSQGLFEGWVKKLHGYAMSNASVKEDKTYPAFLSCQVKGRLAWTDETTFLFLKCLLAEK